MRQCVRCLAPRGEESFYSKSTHPKFDPNVCKPCIHRPIRASVTKLKTLTNRIERTQAAVRYVVKHAQAGKPFVYLLRVGIFYKIGFSADINKRVRQLSTGSSEPIHLIAVAPGDQLLEQKLHREFRAHHVRLEWFRCHPRIVDVFSKLPDSMVFLPGYVSVEAPPHSKR